MSLGNLFSCMFFTHEDPDKENIQKMSATLQSVDQKLTRIEQARLPPNLRNNQQTKGNSSKQIISERHAYLIEK